MHWQEACAQSKYGNAWRESGHCHMVRYTDGSATISHNGRGFVMREAERSEVEGFDDWEPVK